MSFTPINYNIKTVIHKKALRTRLTLPGAVCVWFGDWKLKHNICMPMVKNVHNLKFLKILNRILQNRHVRTRGSCAHGITKNAAVAYNTLGIECQPTPAAMLVALHGCQTYLGPVYIDQDQEQWVSNFYGDSLRSQMVPQCKFGTAA